MIIGEAWMTDRDPIAKALDELRKVLDKQIDYSLESDREILQVVRLNLLILGALVTVFAYNPNPKFINPWVGVGVAFLLGSMLIATTQYHSSRIFAGLGDASNISWDGLITEDQNDQERLTDMIDAYTQGIQHNNIEGRYKSMIYRRMLYLLIIAFPLLAIGVGNAVTVTPIPFSWVISLLLTLLGLGIFLDAIIGYIMFRDRTENLSISNHSDERMEYDHYGPTTLFFLQARKNRREDKSEEPSSDQVEPSGE